MVKERRGGHVGYRRFAVHAQLASVVVGALVAAACGSSPSGNAAVGGQAESAPAAQVAEPAMVGDESAAAQPGAQPTDQDRVLASGFQRCDPGASLPSAPDDWYRDTPRYVGNEQPTAAVQSWASRQPGYQEVWIDRERNGWVTVAFDRPVDEIQRQLEAEFPGDGVVAVQVSWNQAELRALQQRRRGEQISDEERASLPPEPPPTPGGVVIGTGLEIATTDEQLRVAWQASLAAVNGLRVDTPLPEVDFDREVVVIGHMVESGSCRELIFDVIVDLSVDDGVGSRGAVTVDIGPSDLSSVCTADANSLVWAIAVERASLPTGPFELNGVAGVPGLWVEADLSRPGASVADNATIASAPGSEPGAFAQDPRPTAPPSPVAPTPAPMRRPFPDVLEPGFARVVTLTGDCIPALGPLNDFVWAPENPELQHGSPDDWLVLEQPDGSIELQMLLTVVPDGEPTLDVTGAGRTERYLIADIAPAC